MGKLNDVIVELKPILDRGVELENLLYNLRNQKDEDSKLANSISALNSELENLFNDLESLVYDIEHKRINAIDQILARLNRISETFEDVF